MSVISEAHRGLERAVDAYVRATSGDSSFLTGWVLVSSLNEAQEGESDGYMMTSSRGLPFHMQVGLLAVAKDSLRNESLLAQMRS